MMPNEPDTTAPDAWPTARKRGILVELPSGAKARLRRTLHLHTMIENGLVPNPLAKYVNGLMAMGEQTGEVQSLSLADLDPEALEVMMKMMRDEIPHIFVEPRVELVPDGEDPNSWEPDDPGTLSIMDISVEDRSFAYSFGQGAPADLARFRQASQGLAALADEQAVQLPSEPVVAPG